MSGKQFNQQQKVAIVENTKEIGIEEASMTQSDDSHKGNKP